MSLNSFEPTQKIQSALLNENFEGLADGSLIENGAIDSEKLNATIAFGAYPSGATNLAAGSSTKIAFDTEYYDRGGDFDVSNNRFIVPLAGVYHFDTLVNLDSGNESARIEWWVNGSVVAYGHHIDAASVAGVGANLMAGSYEDILAADDYVEVYVFTDDGVDTSSGITNRFTGHLVGN